MAARVAALAVTVALLGAASPVHGARALQARTEDGAGRELNQYVIIIPAVATAISRATDNCATGSNQNQFNKGLTSYTSNNCYSAPPSAPGGAQKSSPMWYGDAGTGSVCVMSCYGLQNCGTKANTCSALSTTGAATTVSCAGGNTVLGVTQASFCTSPASGTLGTNINNNGLCMSSSVANANSALTVLCACSQPGVGQYTAKPCDGCANGFCQTDTTLASCTNAPVGATYTTPDTPPTSATGCTWKCPLGQMAYNGKCTPFLQVPGRSSPPPPTVQVVPALCGGAAFPIEDAAKNLCLHVKGGVGADGKFALSPASRPVVTMQCTAGSPNQLFSFTPGASSGVLRHDASGLVLFVALGEESMRDGSTVTVLPAQAGSTTQAWVWDNPTTGGTLSSASNADFELTDAKVNANANIGLPVHMWRLAASLPSGRPNTNWMAGCAA